MTNNAKKLKPATAFFMEKTFNYQQIIEAESELEELIKFSGTEGQITMLVGESGTGKTKFIDRLKKNYPPIKKDNFTFAVPQIVEISPVPGASTKMIYEEILGELSITPIGNETRLKRQLKTVIANSCVKLIVIDELQHVLPHKSDSKKAQKVADTIKLIADQTKCTFLLVGLESSLSMINSAQTSQKSPTQQDKEQLFRRSRSYIRLTPISHLDDFQMNKILIGFSMIFEQIRIEFGIRTINLSDPGTSRMLWAASQGYIGRLGQIFREAIELVEEKGQIQLRHLACGYEKVNNWENSKKNIFKLNSKELEAFISLLPKYEEFNEKVSHDK
jgi:energy-coupling factor transporter ATP-binding protein EcfA2